MEPISAVVMGAVLEVVQALYAISARIWGEWKPLRKDREGRCPIVLRGWFSVTF